MKYLIALFLLAPCFFASQKADAMLVKIDSVYADSIFYGEQVGATPETNPKASYGKPDSQFSNFVAGSQMDIGFRNHAHTDLIVIKPNSTVLIWGKKDLTVDSSAGQAVFFKVAPDGAILAQSKPIILGDGLNIITVPNDNYTYIELSLALVYDHPSFNHAKSYYIDAIALLQDTLTPVSVRMAPELASSIKSFPNPFIANTTIHFELKIEGEIQLAVVDGLGREVERIDAGYLTGGVHDIPLAMRSAGYYFIRLLLNGKPIGDPLKITSR